jgi:hypothetical protein
VSAFLADRRRRVVTAPRIDFVTINHAALAAFPAVLARVLPSGKLSHREWFALILELMSGAVIIRLRH